MNQNEPIKAEWNDLIGELEKRRDRLAGPWTEHPEIEDPVLALQAVKADRNLLFPLRESDIRQLDEGDGNELEWKMRKANSSAALALNVFHALRDGRSLDIAGIGRFSEYELEKKLPVFQNSNRPANLDVHLRNRECDVFIESKFTEPFNPLREECREGGWGKAYQEEDRYVDPGLFEAVRFYRYRKFQYYDAPQIVRHAMALYREAAEHPETYRGRKIVLLNLAWEIANPQNRFPALYGIQLKIWDELNDFGPTFRNRMQKLFAQRGVDFDFIYLSYNDFLEETADLEAMDPETAEYVRERYLFLYSEAESRTDQLRGFFHSLSGEDNRMDFLRVVRGKEIERVETPKKNGMDSADRKPIEYPGEILLLKDLNRLGTMAEIPRIQGKYQVLDSFNHFGRSEWLFLRDRPNSNRDSSSDEIIEYFASVQ